MAKIIPTLNTEIDAVKRANVITKREEEQAFAVARHAKLTKNIASAEAVIRGEKQSEFPVKEWRAMLKRWKSDLGFIERSKNYKHAMAA